jgi:hypothetical protein
VQTKSVVFLLVPRVPRPGRLVFLDFKAKFRSNVDKASCFILLWTEVFQKAWVLRRLACWDRKYEFRWGHGCLSIVNLCDGLITCPKKFSRVCLSVNMIRCNNNPLPLQSVGRKGQTNTERKKCFRQMCSYPAFATDFIQSHLIHLISLMGLPNLVRILHKASFLTES